MSFAFDQTDEVAALRAENERLRAAVRNQCGDNLCWLSNPATDPIPPQAEFLESCRRFHAQRSGISGELAGCRTIAQLEADSQRLRDALKPFAEKGATESLNDLRCILSAIFKDWLKPEDFQYAAEALAVEGSHEPQ